MSGKISPSIMCADFCNLGRDLRTFEELRIEYLHIDIMDGTFVPNYTLGTDFVKALHAATDIPLDIHLMIDEPERKIDWFELNPNDYVSIHYESTRHVQRTLQRIKDRGAKTMLALNPATPLCVLEDVLPDLDAVLIMTVNPGFAGQKIVPQTLDKIKRCKKLLNERGYEHVEIEADGNVSFENAAKMRAAGADIFVAGTSSILAPGKDLAVETKKFREVIA
ncbi:MAG: ribulose-phosphate 3-epimerase [Oscillospiraceae bacterium]|nr:ribulose-phosphate 3-epimerase [Oscillospiraceae bacterium]